MPKAMQVQGPLPHARQPVAMVCSTAKRLGEWAGPPWTSVGMRRNCRLTRMQECDGSYSPLPGKASPFQSPIGVARDASGNASELPVPTPRMGSKAKKRSRFRIFSRAGRARCAGCWRWMSEAKIPNELCMLLFVYLYVCLVHRYVRTCGPHQPLPDLQLRFVVTSDAAQQNSAPSQAGTEIASCTNMHWDFRSSVKAPNLMQRMMIHDWSFSRNVQLLIP